MTNVDSTNALQRTFKVMGCTAHLVVHGGTAAMLDEGERRLRELESWWSRFLPDSDITRANLHPGEAVVVEPDTLAVVARAIDGWKQTDGRFDVTVLPALVHEGYSHSVVTRDLAPSLPATRIGTSGWIVYDYGSSTLTVPPGSAIDLGGIGKSWSARRAGRLLAERADDARIVVDAGGDVHVERGGELVRTPAGPVHVVAGHGVATSSSERRAWARAGGERAHHLIDAATGRPGARGTAVVTGADLVACDVLATCLVLDPDLLDALDVPAARLDVDGTLRINAHWPEVAA